ncbi:hypothetical protein B0H14DRAFT_2656772 [Mycena olivaceomarginata]|nr:hypothetical protein B0H14DRAFT_2656772 [Mycena olivaceomarginata]
MAHCPALWSADAVPVRPLFPHCGAGGSMMNARSHDGTSDGAGHLRLGTVRPPWRHCWWKRWQMWWHRAAQGSDCSSNSHLLGCYISVVEQGGAAPAEKWQHKDHPAFPAAGHDDRDVWCSVQGARVGMGTGQRYSVTLCLVRRRIGGQVVWVLVWCRSAGSRQADYSVVVKRRCGVARKAHICWNCRGQYRMCRQPSRGAAVWSIAEALPGAAAYEMYALHGAGWSVDECIA